MRKPNSQRGEHLITMGDQSAILKWSMATFSLIFDEMEITTLDQMNERLYAGAPADMKIALEATLQEGDVNALLDAMVRPHDFLKLRNKILQVTAPLTEDVLEKIPDDSEGDDTEGKPETPKS